MLTFIECNDLDIVSAMCDCFMALLITSSLCCVYTASIGLSIKANISHLCCQETKLLHLGTNYCLYASSLVPKANFLPKQYNQALVSHPLVRPFLRSICASIRSVIRWLLWIIRMFFPFQWKSTRKKVIMERDQASSHCSLSIDYSPQILRYNESLHLAQRS